MINDALLQDIRFVKGIGPKRAKKFLRLGIKTIKDLLYFFPRRYEDRRVVSKISESGPNQIVTLMGDVVATNLRRTRRGLSIFEAAVDDGTGIIVATWFNQPYLKDLVKKNQRLLLYGKIDYYKGLRILCQDYEILEGQAVNLGILPVYPLTAKLNQRFMRKLIKNTLQAYAHILGDFLPYDIRERQGLLNRVKAMRNIHFPENEDLLYSAQKRFAFEEVFLLQIAVGIKRLKRKYFVQGISHRFDYDLRQRFKQILPFELTRDQEKAFDQIEKDMVSLRPMNRLVQGEVGSGKTMVACYACLIAGNSGSQTAIMVPTEILAQQQYVKIGELLSKFDLEVGILISGMDKKYRQEVIDGIKNGTIDVVIGTHALIQEGIEFKNLGLVIIDEQHKFGVKQREILRQKGKVPDYLIMTATPIPRTLALTLFGELDISTIKESPYGEKNINTYWVPEEIRESVYEFVKEMVSKDWQGFVVCPRIEYDLEEEITAVQKVYQEVKQLLGENKVLLLHGKMSADEKKKIVEKFYTGEFKVLVSTIVIEVGIDVPDASFLIIEQADRFGLSQLHQLRGRIGRLGQQSYCILIADPKTESATKRLEAMVHIEDGFRISEQDLDIRGPGELFGLRQHGFLDIQFKNLINQMDLLNQARQEAFNLLKKDPYLNATFNKSLKEEFLTRYSHLAINNTVIS